jgi:hypothetical protein
VVVLINDFIISDKLQHHSTVCLFQAVPRAIAMRADLSSRYDAVQFPIVCLRRWSLMLVRGLIRCAEVNSQAKSS